MTDRDHLLEAIAAINVAVQHVQSAKGIGLIHRGQVLDKLLAVERAIERITPPLVEATREEAAQQATAKFWGEVNRRRSAMTPPPAPDQEKPHDLPSTPDD